MKKQTIILLLAASPMMSTSAIADPQDAGWYVTPKFVVGQQKVKDKTDRSYTDHVVPGNSYSASSSSSDDKFRPGSGLSVGHDFYVKFKVPVRVELEYAGMSKYSDTERWQNNGVDYKLKDSLDMTTLFVNAYWDWRNSSAFTPYAGFGLGMSTLSGEIKYNINGTTVNTSLKERSDNFAWNVGLGMGIRLTDAMTLDVGYRYVDPGKFKARDAASTTQASYSLQRSRDLTVHQALLGLRFTF